MLAVHDPERRIRRRAQAFAAAVQHGGGNIGQQPIGRSDPLPQRGAEEPGPAADLEHLWTRRQLQGADAVRQAMRRRPLDRRVGVIGGGGAIEGAAEALATEIHPRLPSP